MFTKVFIHGLDSSSRGTKAQYFREHYPEMLIEDFTGTFQEKMEQLDRLLSGRTNLILVGSSYGGLMAALFALKNPERVHRLILLAPALNMPEFNPPPSVKLHLPVIIYHGINDELIPGDLLEITARRHFLNLDFHLVPDDHSLHGTFRNLPWDRLFDKG